MDPLLQGRSEVVRLPQLRSDFLLETSGPITRAAKNTEIKVPAMLQVRYIKIRKQKKIEVLHGVKKFWSSFFITQLCTYIYIYITNRR